jgi:cupin fold WbuC family metalloprotein
MIRYIDTSLLDAASAAARASPRGRRNLNFHHDDAQPGHRLLNAIEPGSYVMPHRHLEADKDETIVALRGRLGLVVFADDGAVTHATVLGPGQGALGVDLPHGTWHSVLALEAGTVFLEAKAGPYRPLADAEKAPWAPVEGSEGAPAYLAFMRGLFPAAS